MCVFTLFIIKLALCRQKDEKCYLYINLFREKLRLYITRYLFQTSVAMRQHGDSIAKKQRVSEN